MPMHRVTKLLASMAVIALTVLPALALPAIASRSLIWCEQGSQTVGANSARPASIMFSRSGNVYVVSDK